MTDGKNILLFEPMAARRHALAHALNVAGYAVTHVTKMPTVLPADAWLVAGGDDALSHTALLRERLGSGDAAVNCFHILPAGDKAAGQVHGIEVPFRLQDFVAALARAVNRPRSIAVAGHTLHVARRQFEKSDGTSVALTEKEVAILLYLSAAKAPVPRDALMHGVWGYHPDATTHTLETHVYRLRQKIEIDPENPRILMTTETGYALG